MNKEIKEILEIYKKERSKYLDAIYKEKEWTVKNIFRKKIKPSEEWFIAKEIAFQEHLLNDISIISELKKLQGSSVDWSKAILILKNKSERLGFRIDYLNYLHAFLAFTLTILVILAKNLGPQNWIVVAIVSFFIYKAFSERSVLRFELEMYKELINLIEFNEKKK